MEDSGKRQNFDTGAIRDTTEDKPRVDLISPYAQLREGAWLAKGAQKYTERNWEQGIPFSRCIASLERHVQQFKQGLTNEDHLAAIVANATFIMHYEAMIERGLLPATLDDMPKYEQALLQETYWETATEPVEDTDEFKVENCLDYDCSSPGFFIESDHKYLWRDGTLHNCLLDEHPKILGEAGWYKTRKEAEETLRKYLAAQKKPKRKLKVDYWENYYYIYDSIGEVFLYDDFTFRGLPISTKRDNGGWYRTRSQAEAILQAYLKGNKT